MNRHKGEAALNVEGREYTLVFDVNALCDVEHLLAMPTNAILSALAKDPPLHVVRALLWGGLRTHHAGVDLMGAGALMEKVGGAGPALEAIGNAMAASFPDPDPEAAKGKMSPRKGATAGTGRRS